MKVPFTRAIQKQRGRWSSVFLSCLLVGCLWQCTQKSDLKREAQTHPEDRVFTILQVNDVYRIEGIENGSLGGFGRLRTLRMELEAKDDVLLLHGGDLLFPSVMSREFEARTMVEALNRLDGDKDRFDERLMVVFGNHEFDEDQPIFDARIRQSDFTWLGTNMLYSRKKDQPKKPIYEMFQQVLPHKVMSVAGVRVGIFSVTLDDYTADYIGFDYNEKVNQKQIASIRDTVNYLEDRKVDVLIALTHQTFDMDKKLGRDVPEIDLIIGGHEHVALQSDQGTSITKADSDAISAWVIEVDARQPGKPKLKKKLHHLNDSIKKESKMQAYVEEQVMTLSRSIEDYFTAYGSTVHKLEGLESEIRSRETAMGNWLADAARGKMGTDIAFLNGGGIRINDNIPAGSDIRGEHLAGIFYYPTRLVSMNLTGAQILDILNNSVSMVDRGSGRFLQISGMRFKYRKANEAKEGARFVVVEDTVTVLDKNQQFRPLDRQRTYSITTSSYLWKNGYGDGYAIFSKGDGGTSPPLTSDLNAKIDLRKVIEADLKKQPVVKSQIDGRIGRMSPMKGS